jgi:hypothetical protein
VYGWAADERAVYVTKGVGGEIPSFG